MTFRDRTSEFEALVERLQQRHDGSALERRSLLNNSSVGHDKVKNKTEFSLIAAEIGRNIATTSAKLEKLTKCKYGQYAWYASTKLLISNIQWRSGKLCSMINR
jgi:hypothetical protein